MHNPLTAEASSTLDWQELQVGADPLGAYLREIGGVPLLSAAEEVALGKAIHRSGLALEHLSRTDLGPRQQAALRRAVIAGKVAERQLAESNLRLVVSIAKRYMYSGIAMADLVQEGNLGLLKAVRKYDYRLRYRFSTYATSWIRQAIGRVVAQHRRSIRVPAHVAESLSLLRRAHQHLLQDLGREPTMDELAIRVDPFSDEERAQLQVARTPSGPARGGAPSALLKRLEKARAHVTVLAGCMWEMLSLDSPVAFPVGDDDAASLGELIPSAQTNGPADEVLAKAMRDSLTSTLRELPVRQQVVLRCRYGLDDVEAMTLEEIGEQLGVTRERVRQIEVAALKALRIGSRGRELALLLA